MCGVEVSMRRPLPSRGAHGQRTTSISCYAWQQYVRGCWTWGTEALERRWRARHADGNLGQGEVPEKCVGGKQAQGRAPRGTALQQRAETVSPRKAGREELAEERPTGPQRRDRSG